MAGNTDGPQAPTIEQGQAVPDCHACGQLLGLYYAECLTCFGSADRYSLHDYEAQLRTVALGRPGS